MVMVGKQPFTLKDVFLFSLFSLLISQLVIISCSRRPPVFLFVFFLFLKQSNSKSPENSKLTGTPLSPSRYFTCDATESPGFAGKYARVL